MQNSRSLHFNSPSIIMTELNQFETIFEYANEAIVIADSKGCIKKINPAGQSMFGYSPSDVLPKTINELMPQRYHSVHEKHLSGYQHKPKARPMGAELDLYAIRKNGQEFPVEASLSPCRLNDEDMVVAFIIDITERKKSEIRAKNYQEHLEQEVEDRTLILKEAISNLENTKKKLDKSLQKERDLNQLKSKFISTASHEFRTPLATVMSSVSLIEKYSKMEEPEKLLKHVDRIKKSIKNLTEILDDILSVNKIEEGKVVVLPYEIDLIYFISELIAEVKIITKKGQTIAFETSKAQKLSIIQDPKLLRHILLNLLSNAIKFSNEDSEIMVTVYEEKNNVIIKIKDQGIGIPPESLQHIFTRFYRSENAGQIQGTGLGLAIVKQYTELLKGKITCESKTNDGAEFTLSLPKSISIK